MEVERGEVLLPVARYQAEGNRLICSIIGIFNLWLEPVAQYLGIRTGNRVVALSERFQALRGLAAVLGQ